jgi:hypothetical protein
MGLGCFFNDPKMHNLGMDLGGGGGLIEGKLCNRHIIP